MIKGICTSKSSPYIALVLLVLLTNLIIAPRYYSNSEELSPDPALYHETAKAIARGETEVLLPSGNRHDIGYLMAPGYSYLLAGVYGLFSPMPVYGYFLNILFHVAAILLIFYLASKVMNLFFAGFLTVWLNFYFLLWRMNFSLMMEISTLFLLILSFYFLYRFVSSKKIYTLVCSGLSFGYLMFLNNRFLLHFIILLLFLSISVLRGRVFKLKEIGIFLLVALLVLIPWHIRQYRTYKHFVFFSPVRTVQMLPGILIRTLPIDRDAIPSEYSTTEIKSYEEYLAELENKDGWDEQRTAGIRNRFTSEKYEELIEQYDREYSKPYARIFSRLRGFWEIVRFDFSFNYGGDTRLITPASKMVNMINLLFLTPMFLFFPLGIFFGIYRRELFIQMFSLVVISHWLLHGFVHYIGRYRIPVLPLIFFVAWYGIFSLYSVAMQEIGDRRKAGLSD